MITYPLVVILVTVVIVTFVLIFGLYKLFAPSKSAPMDPALESIVKETLRDHFKTMETGKFVANRYLGAELIPLLEKKAAEFANILSSGVQVESGVKDINKIRLQVLYESDSLIKIKASGYFKQKYLHNGREIMIPSDPESYLASGNTSDFEAGYYELNFLKSRPGHYELIGINDDLMGNGLGEL